MAITLHRPHKKFRNEVSGNMLTSQEEIAVGASKEEWKSCQGGK